MQIWKLIDQIATLKSSHEASSKRRASTQHQSSVHINIEDNKDNETHQDKETDTVLGRNPPTSACKDEDVAQESPGILNAAEATPLQSQVRLGKQAIQSIRQGSGQDSADMASLHTVRLHDLLCCIAFTCLSGKKSLIGAAADSPDHTLTN